MTGFLVVSPAGPYTTPQAALADAGPGDVIEVRPGTYPGPLVVDRPVTLAGVGWPVIDGGGQGTVVTLAAPGIVFSGFEVRGSGVEPDRDHAGLTLTAPDITVEGNRLHDVLFGIFVAQADRAVVRGNQISSKSEFEPGRRGDGIRVWYSQDVVLERNHLHSARDLVLWYSAGLVVRGNLIERGRYGIHLMYCDDALIERNQLRDNSVGVYAMYSAGVRLIENDIRGQRGPSGYALGFKDADGVEARGNVLADNRAGVFLDGTPFSPASFARFEGNILAFNDAGVLLLTGVRANTFAGNTFWENVEQVAIQGGGRAGDHVWQGNYWSDYAGFDAGQDGTGDTPYRADRLFGNLTDREPLLRALIYSPAAQAVEFTASAFPLVRPQPKLVDAAPRIEPARLPEFAALPAQPSGAMAALGAGLLALSLGWGALALRPGPAEPAASQPKSLQSTAAARVRAQTGPREAPAVRVTKASKHYGRLAALEGVSFDVAPGEAVALWGANGAGKSTLIKAMLGLVDCQGEIEVLGCDVRRNGKAVRRSLGYVPQEAVFYDLSVRATLEFYAALKEGGGGAASPRSRLPGLLDELGLREFARTPVPALSGGLKQRLALAIALLADPPVLLLDEPTASLDAEARAGYLARLGALRGEKKTLVFATHRLEEVEALADRVLVLHAGRLTGELPPEALRLRLMPEVELTLWVPDGRLPDALACLSRAGFQTHLNGRGTLVVRVDSKLKVQPLDLLRQHGVAVLDFEMERIRTGPGSGERSA